MPGEFRAKIINKTSRLDARFVDMKYIEDKFHAREQKLKDDVGALISRQIRLEANRHRVVKALRNPHRGIGGEDLPAAFGLTATKAEEAASQIVDVLGDAVVVQVETGSVRRIKGMPSLNFKITPKFLNEQDFSDDFDEDPFVYKSRRSTVPWMKWVLNPRQADALIYSDLTNIKNYGIVYDVPTHIMAQYSRSGRALMLRKNTENNRRYQIFDFRLPAIVKPVTGSKNFVEEIGNDKFFRSRLDGYIKNAVDKILGGV